jgi:hypothetical protein
MVRVLGLVFCGMVAWGQKPSDADTAALIERSRQKALDYTQQLPDFMCTEMVHRSISSDGGQQSSDTLTIKLSYSKRGEEHKLELINGKPTDRKYEDLEGATSTGQFGGILRVIFNPASQAAFDWQTWKTLRKKRVAVLEYAVSAATSPYYLGYQGRKAIVGLHGVLEIDGETGEVLHLTFVAYDIPQQLNVLSAVSSVDYAFADVGGREYLLPVHSEMELHSPGVFARNKTEFREYRKFSAESVVDFGVGK